MLASSNILLVKYKVNQSCSLTIVSDNSDDEPSYNLNTDNVELADSDFDSVMNNLQTNLCNMEKNNKKHATELDNFDIDSKAYSEGENHFAYDILEDMLLSDKDENTENESEFEMKDFVFEGSAITVSTGMVLILSYSCRFSSSSAASSHLLLLLNWILPNGSKLCKTLHYFRQHFKSIKTPMVYHHCTLSFYKNQ